MATAAWPPAFLISAATRAASASRRPCTTTRAPSAANALAIASPIPLLLPVTNARLPAS